jgi:membrane protease subunit HflK
VAEATGRAARFLKVFEEYKKAPEAARERMYLETMERVLGGTDKIILDSKGGQGGVPFQPLDQLQRHNGEGKCYLCPLQHSHPKTRVTGAIYAASSWLAD